MNRRREMNPVLKVRPPRGWYEKHDPDHNICFACTATICGTETDNALRNGEQMADAKSR
jgi:hypothetical protein